MSTKQQVNRAACPVKSDLDRLELVERVPALRRAAVSIRFGEEGNMILNLPHHPAVTAYSNHLKFRDWPDVDLRTARRLLKKASVNYENRVAFRFQHDIEWSDGGKFVSLSAILEARAEAMHWRKIVIEKETAKRIKDHNERATVRHRLNSLGLAC